MSRLVILLLTSITIFSSCQKEESVETTIRKTSFVVDSIRIYDATDISKNKFMFSPFPELDRVWTINTANAHELDLKSGKWTPLTNRFGKSLEKQIREEAIWEDQYTSDIYISVFRSGLIRQPSTALSYDLINIKSVTAFYPRKQDILLGTSNSLYQLDRSNNEISKVDGFPLGTWVNSISAQGTDTLIINNKNYFHIPSGTYGLAKRYNKNKKANTNYNYLTPDIKSKLPHSGLKQFKSDSTSWYYNSNSLFYASNNSDYFQFDRFPQGKIRHLLEDDNHLYLLYNEQFVIINKQYIFANSTKHDVALYQRLRDDLYDKHSKLNQHNVSFDDRLKMSIDLYNNKNYRAYSSLQRFIDALPRVYTHGTRYKEAKNIDDQLADKDVPEIYKWNILKGLCAYHVREGRFDKAIERFDQIEHNSAVLNDNCLSVTKKYVVKHEAYLDSLKEVGTPEDQLLYLEGRSLETFIVKGCWFGETYVDLGLVFRKYRELADRYPNSEYIDDADFRLIELNDDTESNYVSFLNNFLKKHPESEYAPKVMLKTAYYQSHQIEGGNQANSLQQCEKTINTVSNLLSSYALDSLQQSKARTLFEQLIYEKAALTFELSVTPLKTDNSTEEDIEVEVVLTNKTKSSQEISLFENGSYFSFDVRSSEFEANASLSADTSRVQIQIAAEESLTQTLTLNKNVRHWDGGRPGTFNFEEEGIYNLSCFSRINKLSSPQVKLYVQGE